MSRNRRAHYCLENPALSAQRYFTPQPRASIFRRQNADRTRLILLLMPLGALVINGTHWPEVLESSTSSKGSPSSRTAWRCSPGMSAEITLVFEALVRMSTAAAWRLTALHLAIAAAEYYDVVGIGEVGRTGVSPNLNPWVILQSQA